MTSTLDNILSNPGLVDIRDQIFGYFDHETLEICGEVFAQRFGEDWDVWLERLASIQYMVEFGDKMVIHIGLVKDRIPGWFKGVKTFGNLASLKDLNEVKGSMKELLNWFEEYDRHPVYFIVRGDHVKLMELLFHTDFDLNQSEHFNPLHAACFFGHTKIVKLMVNSSKKFGIELNARDDNHYAGCETGFMCACFNGNTEIVKLMVNSSKEFGIELNTRNASGETGFMMAHRRGYTDTVNLMVKASEGDEHEPGHLGLGDDDDEELFDIDSGSSDEDIQFIGEDELDDSNEDENEEDSNDSSEADDEDADEDDAEQEGDEAEEDDDDEEEVVEGDQEMASEDDDQWEDLSDVEQA